MTDSGEIKLTQYSHGAGCGCKISPAVLETILSTNHKPNPDPNLLVGNEGRDDAAVYDLEDGTAIISTTDFFMPIVDDPFDFGRIASVNAMSDVYAMGGKPMVAIAILGWPVDKLPASVAQKVLEGSRSACAEAGITVAGGHSIDSPEPIFGLAVTGRVNVGRLRTNGGATAGCKLFLTKPLGVGILTTAEKKGILDPKHATIARDSMVKLNDIGAVFSQFAYVKALTDVTGFGLLGHLTEMCEAAKLSAEVWYDKVPRFPEVNDYIDKGSMPGGTGRNFTSYGHKVSKMTDKQRALLCDPQTSGGLLVAVVPEYEAEFVQMAKAQGYPLEAFGVMTERRDPLITVV